MLYFATLSTNNLPIIKVIYFIKVLLSIIFIIVPIILIITSTIELFKLMNNPNETGKSVPKIINKMISAVVIFFIPVITNFIMTSISQDSLNKIEYWTSVDEKTIKLLTKIKEKESLLKKRVKNEEKVKEYQEKSVAIIEDLEALKDYLGDKLNQKEKNEIEEIIRENKESVKNKLSDGKRDEVLKLIDELKNYSLPNASYALNELKNIIENQNEGQNQDLVYKYIDDINGSLLELDPTNYKAETAYEKLIDDIDITSADVKSINSSMKKTSNKINELQKKILKEVAESQNNNNNNTVYAATSSSTRNQIVNFALQHVGVTPYVYGGTSLTKGADCSGFVQAVYAHFGINIPRTTNTQASAGKKVSLSNLRPGDLIFSGNYGHVTMYIGNNQVVQAQCTKCGPVKITKIPNSAHDAVSFIND